MNEILVCPRDMCKVFAEPHSLMNPVLALEEEEDKNNRCVFI
jgi:hypothetical protein